jgi:hypothetical protein
MTIEQLEAIHQATPFKPFTIHLADGRSLHVPHRDFLLRHPRGRTLFVFGEDDNFSVIDLLLVTELEVGNGRARRRERHSKH